MSAGADMNDPIRAAEAADLPPLPAHSMTANMTAIPMQWRVRARLYAEGYAREALRAALPGLREAPAGWKLVPVEPSETMAGSGARVLIDALELRPSSSWAEEAANAYRAMLAAAPSAAGLREAGEPVAWRPIETAPRNGDVFLGYWRGYVRDSSALQRADGVVWSFGGKSFHERHADASNIPTHWMPLPAAPGAAPPSPAPQGERAQTTEPFDWQAAVYSLMGYAVVEKGAGKQDMPAFFMELAEAIARAHLDEAHADRVRAVATKEGIAK